MKRGGWSRAVLGTALAAACVSARAQDLTVRCEHGCTDPGTNRSLNLLMREDATGSVTLTWETGTDPAAGGREVLLYAGNPEAQDTIPARGLLEFRQAADVWRASREFRSDELGRGTFLAVVTSRPQGTGDDPWGERERILDWRAFRLLTVAEARARATGPPPGSAWGVTVTPALLQARTGHGNLPRSQGGDTAVWWSMLGSEGNTADVDLDGENNGVPGLGIQVSTPWETRAGDDWKAAVMTHLTGVQGHTIHFEGLQWNEVPDRPVDIPGVKLVLRNYYTAITLHTNASMKTFDKDEFRGGTAFLAKPTYFSHETSAPLKGPDDPRLWASYSRREYGGDRRLLAMLQRQVEAAGSVPGLAGLQRKDGDGGAPSYTAGFYVEVHPWGEDGGPPRDPMLRAGIVSVDVVAARVGVGGLTTHGSGGAGTVGEIWCRIIGCGEQDRPIDLDRAPKGYRATSASASLGTLSGSLPLADGSPEIAEKGPINFPYRARFGVTAGLRAGAVMREGSFGYVKDLIAIDTYAQFIAKITVAAFPDTPIIANIDATIPSQKEFRKANTFPVPPPPWWRRHLLLTILGVVGLPLIILMLVPGGMGLVRAVLAVIIKVLKMLVDAISAGLDRLRKKK